MVSSIRAGELYSFLGALPTSSDAALVATLDEDIRDLEARIAADAEKRSTAISGLLVRRRLRTLLSHPRWRTAYDFRHGFVHAAERLAKAAAGEGLSVEELRCIWRRVNPDLAARAAQLLKVPSSSCLLEAAPLDPFHPRIVALASPGLEEDTGASHLWESATTPVEVAWDGDGSLRVVGSLVEEPRGSADEPKATTTTALREAVETKPDGIWADLAHFRMVEILQSLARADTVVELRLCHDGLPYGHLVLDDRLVVHAATPDAIAERALFSLLDARSGELFVRCGASAPPPRNMELRLEAALVRYFEQAAASASASSDDAAMDADLELLPDSEFVLAEVAIEAAPSEAEAAPTPLASESRDAASSEEPKQKQKPPRASLRPRALRRMRPPPKRSAARTLTPRKRTPPVRRTWALTLAFGAGALFVLVAALVGASFAYFLLHGAFVPEPATTPIEPGLLEQDAETRTPVWRLRDALPPRQAAS